MTSEPPTAQSPPSKVLLADAAQPKNVPGRWFLFSAGALLLALFVAGIALAFASGSKTTTESTQPPAASTAAGSGASASRNSVTPAVPLVSKSVSNTTSVPSEGVSLALLGTGVVLILAGALYTRLTAIKLPGGAEIDLSAEEKTAIVEKVASTATAGAAKGASHDEVARTTALALDAAFETARTMKLRGNGALGPDAIERSARIGIQQAWADG